MKRPQIQTLRKVRKLRDWYMAHNEGYTDGIGEFISDQINISQHHVYNCLNYIQVLEATGKWDFAVKENWGQIRIRNYIKMVKDNLSAFKEIQQKTEEIVKQEANKLSTTM